MLIYVKTAYGKTHRLDVDPEEDSVQDLKKIISNIEGVPPDQQQLIFAGEVLGPGCRKLSKYKIQNESTLHLTLLGLAATKARANRVQEVVDSVARLTKVALVALFDEGIFLRTDLDGYTKDELRLKYANLKVDEEMRASQLPGPSPAGQPSGPPNATEKRLDFPTRSSLKDTPHSILQQLSSDEYKHFSELLNNDAEPPTEQQRDVIVKVYALTRMEGCVGGAFANVLANKVVSDSHVSLAQLTSAAMESGTASSKVEKVRSPIHTCIE